MSIYKLVYVLFSLLNFVRPTCYFQVTLTESRVLIHFLIKCHCFIYFMDPFWSRPLNALYIFQKKKNQLIYPNYFKVRLGLQISPLLPLLNYYKDFKQPVYPLISIL